MSENYLRVRGEYGQVYKGHRIKPELPPRTRRIPSKYLLQWRKTGTTSACAENTINEDTQQPTPRNYLRVRGEYMVPGVGFLLISELPPRARRIPRATKRR